jgi:hypothetical protein
MVQPAPELVLPTVSNATSKQHLSPPTTTRLPFSSPMPDEVFSPVSPLDPEVREKLKGAMDPFAGPSASRNPFVDQHNGDDVSEYGDRASPPQQRGQQRQDDPANKSNAGDSLRIQEVVMPQPQLRQPQYAMSPRKPGITVMTNFSRHHGPAPIVAEPIKPSESSDSLLQRYDDTLQPPSQARDGLPREDSDTLPLGTQTLQSSKTNDKGSSDTDNKPQMQESQPPAFVKLSDLKALDGDKAAPPQQKTGFWWTQRNAEQEQVARIKTIQKRQWGLPNNPKVQALTRSKSRGFAKLDDEEGPRNSSEGSRDTAQRDALGISSDGKAADHTRAKNNLPFPIHQMARGNKPVNLVTNDDLLTPSDGRLMIGLTIDSGRLPDYQLSPESAYPGKPKTRPRGKSDLSPATPAIMVTPADDEKSYSAIFSGRQRSESATRMPNNITPITATKKSHFSAITEFDDLETPLTASSTQDFPQAQATRLSGRKRSNTGKSLETPTSALSPRGWWNVLTPFLTRHNTISSRRDLPSPTSASQYGNDQNIPEVPSMYQANEIAAALAQKEKVDAPSDWERDSSPGTPGDVKHHTGHTTMWTDLSAWDDEEMPKFNMEEKEQSDHRSNAHRTQESTTSIPVLMIEGITPSTEFDTTNPFHQSHRRMESEPYEDKNPKGLTIRRPDSNDIISPTDREVSFVLSPELFPPPQAKAPEQMNGFASQSSHSATYPKDRKRSMRQSRASAITEFEDEDDAFDFPNTPVVATAAAVGVTKSGAARQVGGMAPSKSASVDLNSFPTPPTGSQQEGTPVPPPYSPPRTHYQQAKAFPRHVVALHPPSQARLAQPHSPGPLSPGMPQVLQRGIPMSEVPLTPAPAVTRQPPMGTMSSNQYLLPPRAKQVTLADLQTPAEKSRQAEQTRKRHEKEDAVAQKAGNLWRGRGCFPDNGCFGKQTGHAARKRRRYLCMLMIGLIVTVVTIAVVATTVIKSHKKAHVTTVNDFLTISGFPPIPTGVLTVAQPKAVVENSKCVNPSTTWSCALPPELQAANAPSKADQPNFRMQIDYLNDTESSSNTSNTSSKRSVHNAASAGSFIRSFFRRQISTALETPLPSPPSDDDQTFLGNTTDSITAPPFQGEPTPFVITFLAISNSSSIPISKRLVSTSTNTRGAPPGPINIDGTAADSNLLPLPVAQPIRLYNRGLPTEHYGFYNYFNRTIFLKNVPSFSSGAQSEDANGGVLKEDANWRCTFPQTRFKVEIFTNMPKQSLLNGNATSTTSSPKATTTAEAIQQAASNFTQPGSFPLPISVTLDRHGGDLFSNSAFCFGMKNGHYNSTFSFIPENKAAGGTLINGGTKNLNVSTALGGAGGIDGGTGGCACSWANFGS